MYTMKDQNFDWLPVFLGWGITFWRGGVPHHHSWLKVSDLGIREYCSTMPKDFFFVFFSCSFGMPNDSFLSLQPFRYSLGLRIWFRLWLWPPSWAIRDKSIPYTVFEPYNCTTRRVAIFSTKKIRSNTCCRVVMYAIVDRSSFIVHPPWKGNFESHRIESLPGIGMTCVVKNCLWRNISHRVLTRLNRELSQGTF